MKMKVHVWFAGLSVILGICAFYHSIPSTYAGDEKTIKTAIVDIANAIKNGDSEKAKSMAEATAKKIEEIDSLMFMFKTRAKGGIGFGSKKLANAAKDGIEVKLRDLARDASAKDAAAGEEAGYYIAAIAEISMAKAPTKSQGKKTAKNWVDWSKDMRDVGIDFAKASSNKGAGEIKSAAAKVNAACNTCHSVFKE